MELTHLKYFIAVAEELHFGHAARRLHIAQPPLSQQIRKLEEELGVKLFERTSRKVELTRAGKDFLEQARDIVDRAKMSVARMQEHARGEGGLLVIGFNEPAINTVLSRAIKSFHDKYPKVKLVLKETGTADQIEQLHTRKLHLGIMRPYGFDLTGLEQTLLFQENYVLAMAKRHPLERLKKIRLAHLKNQPMVMFPRPVNPTLYRRICKCCTDAGFTPKIVQEAVSKYTTLSLVEAGMGVALVPESCRHISPQEVVYKPVSSNLPVVEICAVWQRNTDSPSLKNFLREIQVFV